MQFISAMTEHRLTSCGFNMAPVLFRENLNFALHLCQAWGAKGPERMRVPFFRSLLFVRNWVSRLFPVKRGSAGCTSSGDLMVCYCGMMLGIETC